MNKENLHEDHRMRMRKRILKEDLNAKVAHEVLEVLLYYAIPRVDTNPIAHRLLNRFKTLGGVFEASEEELCTVEGVGEKTAQFLKMCNILRHFCAMEQQPKQTYYKTVSSVGKFLLPIFTGLNVEKMYLLMFDNQMAMLACEEISEGTVSSVTPNCRKISERLHHYHASYFILAHNHPHGIAIPSADDISSTREIACYFDQMGFRLLEHYLIVGERYMTIIHSKERYDRNGDGWN